MGKKRKKYDKWIGDDNYNAGNYCNDPHPAPSKQELMERSVLDGMVCNLHDDSAFFFGLNDDWPHTYVGSLTRSEGNIIIVGGNGSGKSSGILMPTLRTFGGAICATDPKGELSDWYEKLCNQDIVKRPCIVFDPTQVDGPAYDPFWWLLSDTEVNLINNIRDIAITIAPVMPDDKQPFWAETEQAVLEAALLYYFELGLSFSETLCLILSQSTQALCKTLVQSGDVRIRMLLGETTDMKPETLANIDRGLRNKLMPLATDPYISHAFRGQREGASCFTWDDLNRANIFLRIPEDKVVQWGGMVNLMYAQLIHYLERRPDQYSANGKNNIQTLLLMDEFPRFGKLEQIVDAMATLRSKNVNICLAIQSIAQLDKIYGEYNRRIIFDNCQYRVILRATDADTQKYLCELIGSCIQTQRSLSEHLDDFEDTTGYTKQWSEDREFVVQPHELATLNDVLLLTPQGFCRVRKFQMQNEEMRYVLFAKPEIKLVKQVICELGDYDSEDRCMKRANVVAICERPTQPLIQNKGVEIMTIQERSNNAEGRALAVEHQQRQEAQSKQRAKERKDQRRNYIIGELVTSYFPEVQNFEPGSMEENTSTFEPLEAFLYVLSTDPDLIQDIQARAERLLQNDPDGTWRNRR